MAIGPLSTDKQTFPGRGPEGVGQSLAKRRPRTGPTIIHGFFSARPRFWMRVQRSLPGIRFAAGENVAVSVTYSDGTVEGVVAAIGGRVFIFRELPSPHGKVAKFGKAVEGPP